MNLIRRVGMPPAIVAARAGDLAGREAERRRCEAVELERLREEAEAAEELAARLRESQVRAATWRAHNIRRGLDCIASAGLRRPGRRR